MRNPFTMIQDGFSSIFKSNRNKIESEVAKVKGTKKETGRSKGGGGRSSITAKHVTENKTNDDLSGNEYYNYLRDGGYKSHEANGKNNGKQKRRIRNKIAHKSRRINRIRKLAA